MKSEVSTPVMIGIIVVAVILILGIGWYFLNPGSSAPPPEKRAGTAAIPGQTGQGGQAGGNQPRMMEPNN
jgi:ammonia channel protein AmtB